MGCGTRTALDAPRAVKKQRARLACKSYHCVSHRFSFGCVCVDETTCNLFIGTANTSGASPFGSMRGAFHIIKGMTCILEAGINSPLAVCVVAYPDGICVCVWYESQYGCVRECMHLDAILLSGNLRCWYSRCTSLPPVAPPASVLPHARRFLGKGSPFEARRHGCLIWGENTL